MEKRPLLNLEDEELARSRSKMRRLEDLMPEIEILFGSGVTRQAVLSNLNQQGFDLSMSSFATMLKRLRKRIAKRPAPIERPNSRIVSRDTDASIRAKAVHDQFKENTDRPQTVQHDLTKVPKW